MALHRVREPLLCTWRAFLYISSDPYTHSVNAYWVSTVYAVCRAGRAASGRKRSVPVLPLYIPDAGALQEAGFEGQVSTPAT